MKVLIGYTSKYGATEECAQRLSRIIPNSLTISLDSLTKNFSLQEWDVFILGSPIYAGRIRKSLKKWIQVHLKELLSKPTILFLCGLTPREQTPVFFEKNFPPVLIKKSRQFFLGGAIDFHRLNFFESWVMKKILRSSQNQDRLDDQAIQTLAEALKEISGL